MYLTLSIWVFVSSSSSSSSFFFSSIVVCCGLAVELDNLNGQDFQMRWYGLRTQIGVSMGTPLLFYSILLSSLLLSTLPSIFQFLIHILVQIFVFYRALYPRPAIL